MAVVGGKGAGGRGGGGKGVGEEGFGGRGVVLMECLGGFEF